jgi:hypothetical protein
VVGVCSAGVAWPDCDVDWRSVPGESGRLDSRLEEEAVATSSWAGSEASRQIVREAATATHVRVNLR